MPMERFLLFGGVIAVPGVLFLWIDDALDRPDAWIMLILWSFGFALVGLLVDLTDMDEVNSIRARSIKAAAIFVLAVAFFLPIVADAVGWKP